MTKMSSRDMVDKSVTNILWSYISFFSTKLLNLISIIIAAWYLTPAEFGVMAAALAVMKYFETVTAFGLGASLISVRDNDVQEAADAVFFVSLAFAALTTAVLWTTSGPIAGFLGQAELEPVLDVLAFALFIEAGSAVHNSLLRRDLRFRLKVVPDVVRGLVKGLLSIALALLGFDVWALVVGYLAGAVAFAVTLVIVRPWRPRGLPRLSAVRSALRFGSHLVGAELINGLPSSLDTLAIGKFLGPAAAGLYSVASRMPQLAISTFSMVAGGVVHPVMAQMQGDDAALRKYYYGMARYFTLVTFPGAIALAVLAEPVIHLLYAPAWHPMIPAMQIIAVGLGLGVLNLLPGTVYKAINRTDNLLKTSLLTLPFIVVFIVGAAPYGIEAVAMAKVALVFLRFAPNFYFLRRTIGVTIRETIMAVLPGFACGIAVAGGGVAALRASPEFVLWELAIPTAAMAGVWVVVIAIVAPEILAEVIRLARRMLSRRR